MDTDVTAERRRGIERFPFFIFTLLALLLPLFFIPSAVVSISMAKGLLLFVSVALLIIFWVLMTLQRGSMSFPKTWLFVVLGGVAVVYLVASIFSGQMSLSLIGEGFGTDTFMSVFAGVLLVFLAPLVLKAKRDILTVYVATVTSFVLVGLVQLVRLFAGPDVLTLSTLLSATATLVGKWNDFGIFAGLILLLSILTLEMFPVRKKVVRIFLYIIAVFALFFLVVVQFTPVWYAIGIFFLLLVLYKLSVRVGTNTDVQEGEPTTQMKGGMGRQVPALAVGIVILSIIFIVAGGPLETIVTDYFGTAHVEVRPSWGATGEVAADVLRESPLIGVGPNRFSQAWFMHKPDGVNLTAFWAVPFGLGIGFIPTSLVTTGLLGLGGWLIALVMLLLLGVRSIFRRDVGTSGQYLLLSSFLATLYLWIFLIIYTPGLTLFTLTFIFTGVFLAAVYRMNLLKTAHFSFSEQPLYNFVGALVAVTLLIVVGVGGYAAIARFTGSILHQQGIVVAQTTGDIDAAERSVRRALNFSEQASFYRTLAEIQTGQLGLLLQRDDISPEILRNQFQTLLSNTITSAQRATAIGGDNYRNWMTLGRVYEELVPVGVEGAYDNARETYLRALELYPNGPDILLALARLEARAGNTDNARDFISQALEAKSNYTDAIFLLSQIEVAEGNLAEAIQSVEAATIIEPNNPVVFFQLGLLRYSAGDFAGAASSFEAAVTLNSVYANARYFLGLSYDQLGRRADAIVQFEEVQRLNPDNQEVAFILENLRNDQSPFANVEPPLDAEPESRPELPADEPIIEVEPEEEQATEATVEE